MKIKKGKIVKATEKELYDYWLERNYDEFYSFEEFKKMFIALGTEITDERKNNKSTRR